MLDPIKAGILVPGMGDDGEMQETGIPAAVVTAFLYQHGIVPSRTTDFMVLCLFSVGITKGKWGTLINVLIEFKNTTTAIRRCQSVCLTLPPLMLRTMPVWA